MERHIIAMDLLRKLENLELRYVFHGLALGRLLV